MTSVGGPSMPRSLTRDARVGSRYTRSGWTTVVSLRIQSTGERKTSPRLCASTWARKGTCIVPMTRWCRVPGAGVTDSSPSWSSYRRPSAGSAS